MKHDCQEFYEDYGPHWEEADDLEDGELTHEQQAEHAPDQAGYEADDEERNEGEGAWHAGLRFLEQSTKDNKPTIYRGLRFNLSTLFNGTA